MYNELSRDDMPILSRRTATTMYSPEGCQKQTALGLWRLNNTNHAGKETESKYVFKREQKTGKVVADVTSVGRLFHMRLPATGKARSPTVPTYPTGIGNYLLWMCFQSRWLWCRHRPAGSCRRWCIWERGELPSPSHSSTCRQWV